jgi:hypothetical protein
MNSPPSSLTICAPAAIRRRRVAVSLLRAFLEAAEGHVGDDQRALATARDAGVW